MVKESFPISNCAMEYIVIRKDIDIFIDSNHGGIISYHCKWYRLQSLFLLLLGA